jgi:hypothetical protein
VRALDPIDEGFVRHPRDPNRGLVQLGSGRVLRDCDPDLEVGLRADLVTRSADSRQIMALGTRAETSESVRCSLIFAPRRVGRAGKRSVTKDVARSRSL